VATSSLREMPPESRLVGGAAALLAFSIVLPWYQVSYFAANRPVTDSRSALQVFTWVEAAILLVALAVLYLVWARAQRKAFHLPGGDGLVVSVAGAWAALLLVWRVFDRPDVDDPAATVGIQWGIFVALLAAGGLVAAGARMRAAGRPEPPNPVAEEPGWEVPERRPRERGADARPREHAAVTEVLRERPPGWEGEPPPAPGRQRRPPPPSEDDEPPPEPDRLF
jgi:hypothetical protein